MSAEDDLLAIYQDNVPPDKEAIKRWHDRIFGQPTPDRLLLSDEEMEEVMTLIDAKFGPRPTDPEELHRWKTARHSYVYSPNRQTLNRLRKELDDGEVPNG